MARNKKKRKQYVNPTVKREGVDDIEGDDTLVDIVEVKEVAQDFLERNEKTIIGVIVVGVLLLGAYLAYTYGIKAPKEKAAMESIYKAQEQFAQDSFALALENPGGGFDGFLDIIENYGHTKSGNLAKYYAGVSYLNLGRFDSAIEYLESYSPSDDLTLITKSGALGDAYAESGDLDKALSLYKKAAAAGDNDYLTPYYQFKYGILSKKMGNNDDAVSAFESIQENYPDSNEANDAERYAAMLK